MSVQPELSERQGARVRLVALYRNARQPVRQLTKSLTLLGRAEACDIILASKSVAPAHATIVRLGDTAYVCDLGSRSGTLIDDRRVRWERLVDGQELILGRFRFRIELEEPESGATGEAPTFRLEVPESGLIVDSTDPVLVVGSDAGCDVVLDAPEVAARHCVVAWTQDGPVVRDLGGSNGTRRAGRLVSFGRLLVGDTIGVGPFELVFKVGDPFAAADRPAPGGDEHLLGTDRPSDPSAMVSGRLGTDRVSVLRDLWPEVNTAASEESLEAETARDLDRLEQASADVAAASARLAAPEEEASALAALSRHASGDVEGATFVANDGMVTRRGNAGGESKTASTVVAQAEELDRSKANPTKRSGRVVAEVPETKRIRERILEQAAQLQRRRDLERRRVNVPQPGSTSAGAGYAPSRDRTLDAEPPRVHQLEDRSDASGPSGRTPSGTLERQAFGRDGAGDRMVPERPSPEALERERALQRTTAQLEMELAQTRDELRATKDKYAQHLRRHGTAETRSRKLDQRVAQLRDRVGSAQEALDERARKIRAGLERERERLRQCQEDIKRQAAELEASVREKQRGVEQDAKKRSATLESERAELMALGDALERREAEIESQRRALADREQELEAANQASLAEQDALVESRERELDQRREELETETRAKESERQKLFEAEQRELDRHRDELDEAAGVRQTELDDSEKKAEQAAADALAVRQAELDAQRKQLEERHKAIEASVKDILAKREADLAELRRRIDEEQRAGQESHEVEVAKKEAELAERSKQLFERQAELDTTHKAALARQEAALAKRFAEVEEAGRLKFDKKSAEMDQQTNAKLGEIELELAASRSEHEAKLESLRQRESDLDRVHEQMMARDAALVTRSAELDGGERELEHRANDLHKRDDELARLSSALELRDTRLQEAQARIDAEQEKLESSQATLEDDLTSIEKRAAENGRRAAEIGEREQDVLRRRQELEGQRETLGARVADLDGRDAELQARQDALNRRKHELDLEATRLAEAEDEFRKLEERAQELDERGADLATRNEALQERDLRLNERVASYEREVDGLEQSRGDMSALQAKLDAERRELQEYAAILDQRVARAEGTERRAREARIEQEGEREQLDDLRAQNEARAAQLEVRHQEASQRSTELEEAQMALQLDRQKLAEREQTLVGDKAELARAEDRLGADQSTLSGERANVEADAKRLTTAQDEFGARTATLETDRARLEREQLALKDRERAVAEQRTQLEIAQREAEQTKAALKSRIEESEQTRQTLHEQSGRLAANEKRVAHETLALDERGRMLDRELDDARTQRVSLEADEKRLAEQRQRFDADRSEFEGNRSELEQSRRTFKAGLRDLESREQGLVEREGELAERAKQLESYRTRLEEEYVEVDRQRRELAGTQVEGTATSDRLKLLLGQAESRRDELRAREEETVVHEQALAARAGELAKSEDDVGRRAEDLENRARAIEESERALAAEREEFHSVIKAEQEEAEETRREAEREKAAAREELDQRRRELEIEYAARLKVQETDVASRDEERIVQARRKLDEEYAVRAAALQQKEAEVEARCQDRIAQAERDIARRLVRLEDELKERHRAAEQEAARRESERASETGDVRARADEQLHEMKRRQAALDEERARLRETRGQLEADRQAFEAERASLVTEDEPDVDGESLAADVLDPASLEARAVELDRRQARLSERAQLIREATYELRSFRERLASGDREGADAGEPAVELLERLADFERSADLDEFGPAADADRADETSIRSRGPVDDLPRSADIAPEESGRTTETIAGPPTGRFPVVRALVVSVIFGAVVGAVVYTTRSSTADIEVGGELSLGDGESAALLTADEHRDRVRDILPEASRAAGQDLVKLYESDRLKITPEGGGVRISARVAQQDREVAQGWIDLVGNLYVGSLGRTPDSDADVNARIGKLRAIRAGVARNLQEVRRTIDTLNAELEDDPRLADLDQTVQEKQRRKAASEQAIGDVDAARQALSRAEKTPQPAGPITPSDAERQAAYQSDADLVQAMEQQKAHARRFHRVLSSAMSGAQAPITTLLSTADDFVAKLDEQQSTQTDKDIIEELERIRIDLAEYRDQVAGFAGVWDDLAPKVAGWLQAGGTDALLEYQQRCDDVVRAFEKGSGESLGRAARGIEGLGRSGSEMTKRTILRNLLADLAHKTDDARQSLLGSAIATVRANNAELATLRRTLKDLDARIVGRRSYHDTTLAQHLVKVRADEREARIARLRKTLNDATERRDQAQLAFLAIDERVTEDQALDAEVGRRRAAIGEQEEKAAAYRLEMGGIEKEMERVRSDRTISLAGALTYRPVEAVESALVDLDRLNAAVGWGLGAVVLTLLALWIVVRSPRNDRATPVE